MESVSTLFGEWNSFSGENVSEEAYFMSELINNFSLQNDSLISSSSFEIPSTFWPNYELTTIPDEVDETSVYFLDYTNNSCEILVAQPTKDYKLPTSSRKRSCSTANVDENREKMKCRKSHKLVSKSNDDEGDHGAGFGEIMKIYGSDGESNCSRELSISPRPKEDEVLQINAKTKANKGSATDPQSVYARKRRERINERLRILQKLVPNGTKVDISTMLEEAVQYVKFLQLQIKLLSSDDMWMYAPIAYNGMDIGLNLTIPSPR